MNRSLMETTRPATESITAEQLQQLFESDPELRVIDVRTGGEFETAHIAGSYNVPLDTLGEHARDLAGVERTVVLVCQSGGRASQAYSRLSQAGKRTLHILDGGMAAWQASGRVVVRGENQRWAMDRQVRLAAGSIALAGTAASVVFPPAKWIAGGVAAGLTFSALTDTCAMASALSKLPYNRTDRCDIEGVLAALKA